MPFLVEAVLCHIVSLTLSDNFLVAWQAINRLRNKTTGRDTCCSFFWEVIANRCNKHRTYSPLFSATHQGKASIALGAECQCRWVLMRIGSLSCNILISISWYDLIYVHVTCNITIAMLCVWWVHYFILSYFYNFDFLVVRINQWPGCGWEKWPSYLGIRTGLH